MASLGSSIRSAARATSSAYKSVPIRWRLAGGSAVLTLVILLGFAVIVGTLTARPIRHGFNEEVKTAANDLQQPAAPLLARNNELVCGPNLDVYASAEHAVIRLVRPNGRLAPEILCQTHSAPDLGAPLSETMDVNGYRVESRVVQVL